MLDFDPRDLRAEPLRRAAGLLVGLAAARLQRGELAFERAGLFERAEAGRLHRLGGGARLRLGFGQVAHQHADIGARAFRRRVERLRALFEAAGFLREVMRDPAKPVGRLVAERHQPRGLLGERGAIGLDPVADARQHALERAALLAHRRYRADESLGLHPRAAPEDQPDERDEDQRRADRGRPADPGDQALARPGPAQSKAGKPKPAERDEDQQGAEEQSGPSAAAVSIRRPARRRIRRKREPAAAVSALSGGCGCASLRSTSMLMASCITLGRR